MAIFRIDINGAAFYVIKQPEIITDCSTTVTYNIYAEDGDTIDITLSGNHQLESYNSNGVVNSFNDSVTGIVFDRTLSLTFVLHNSGVSGVFNSSFVTINDTSLSEPSFTDIVTRYNDSENCAGSPGTGGSETYDGLTDTPNSKSGSARKFIRVSDDESFHEYVNITLADIVDYVGFIPTTLLNDYGFVDNSIDWNNAYSWGNHANAGYELIINKGVANGYVPLDNNIKIPIQYLPPATLATTFVVNSEVEMLALSTAITGDIAVRTDLSKSFILRGSDPSVLNDWQELLAPLGAVTSVNTLIGDVTLGLTLTGGLLGITNGNSVNLDLRYSQQTLTAGTNITIDGSNVISAIDTTYSIFNNINDGLVPKRIGSTNVRFLKEDGTWDIPIAGPTYTANTLAELNVGTDTTPKLQTSKRLNDWLNGKNFSTQTLVAGTNINITGNTISAIDTTYTVGTLAQLNTGTDIVGRLQTSKNLNDWLTAKGYITDYNVTVGDVTQYESFLSITESQITDLNHFSGDYNDLINIPPPPTNLVTSVNTKIGDVILGEVDIVGNTQEVNSGTGIVTVNYDTYTQFNMSQVGTVVLEITPPILAIGESTSRIMYFTPNGFDIYFPADFETRVSGIEYLDNTKENWIVTRYTRTSTGIKQFSNLTVFPFNVNNYITGDVDGGASNTDYTLMKHADGGEATTNYTINMSGGSAANN